MSRQVLISDLFSCGAHFGHRTRFRNPKMTQYIYGNRDDLSIIDLDQTKVLFEKALDAIEKIVANNGVVVFVGTKKTAQEVVREFALACNMPYVDKRWLGGMLTNFGTIRALVKRYIDMCSDIESGRFTSLTKKEQLCMNREVIKLEASLGGVRNMKSLPDALFVVDVNEEAIAVREANKLGIPVIALVDTNSNPNGVDYVVPANDDAMSSITFFAKTISDLIAGLNEKRNSEREAHNPKTVISRIKKRKDDEVESVVPEANAEETKVEAKADSSEVSKDGEKPVRKKRVVQKKAADTSGDKK